MSPQQRRAQLNAALRGYREPHDAYIYLISLADETSVPLLMERFRLDHPAGPPPPNPKSEPEPPPVDPFPYQIGRVNRAVSNELIPAFACVHVHLVDALANATNTNRGMYYPAWKAWWDENQHKSSREWIEQGFKEAGLSPSDPIDEQFGIDLIGVLEGSPADEHLAVNARRLLETVPAANRLAWIESAARSEQRNRRLGAVSALRDYHPAGHENLLRTLTADADADVRMNALNTLNARLRQRPDRQARARRVSGPDKKRGFASVILTDDVLVAAGGHGVEAFDARSGRRMWRVPSIAARTVTLLKDRLIASTYDGQLVAFTPQGTVDWRVPDGGGVDVYGNHAGPHRLLALDGHLGVLWEKRLEWRDPDTGLIVHTFTDRSFRISDVDAAGRTMYVLVADQLLKMVEGRVLARRDMWRGVGVSVRDDMICVYRSPDYGSAGAEVACYDAESLDPRWKQPAPRVGGGGRNVAPVQTASHVYAPSGKQLTAFRRDDGAPVWVDRAKQESFGRLLTTSRGLLSAGSGHPLELRAPDSGELLEFWPDKAQGIAVSPSGQIVAFTTADGSLWLLPAHPAR